MRHYRKKALAAGFLLFLGLWVVGVIRAWGSPYPEPPALGLLPVIEAQTSPQSAVSNLRQLGLTAKPLPLVLDGPDVDRIQVFEKNAQLACRTSAFEPDGARVRAAVAAHQAVVFNEKESGLAPHRRLSLEVGIHPERFDALVDDLRQVGHLESVSVQQVDRTEEFRRLHAQRASLNKHRDALQKLRAGKNLSLEDELKLEQRFREIEREFEALGTHLGDLLGKESFYHVYATLYEYPPGGRLDQTFTVAQRLASGLGWALAWWVVVVGSAGLAAGSYFSVRTLFSRQPA